jgi:hypothetical protein
MLTKEAAADLVKANAVPPEYRRHVKALMAGDVAERAAGALFMREIARRNPKLLEKFDFDTVSKAAKTWDRLFNYNIRKADIDVIGGEYKSLQILNLIDRFKSASAAEKLHVYRLLQGIKKKYRTGPDNMYAVEEFFRSTLGQLERGRKIRDNSVVGLVERAFEKNPEAAQYLVALERFRRFGYGAEPVQLAPRTKQVISKFYALLEQFDKEPIQRLKRPVKKALPYIGAAVAVEDFFRDLDFNTRMNDPLTRIPLLVALGERIDRELAKADR